MARRRPGGAMKQGLFITLEGGEGGGKTTQARLLELSLQRRHVHVVRTHEPGDGVLGAEIRRLIMTSKERPLRRAEALLYAADRAQHVETVIRPALLAGKVVVCDRYIGSSLAYQADAGGLNYDQVLNLSTWAADGIVPHLTFFLDVDPVIGLERARSSGDTNRFEDEALTFHRKVRESFVRQAQQKTWRTIDASRTAAEIHQQIVEITLEEARWWQLLPSGAGN